MRYRIITILVISIIVLSCLLCGCGNNRTDNNTDGASPDSSAIQETTVVLETTGDGGTVEQDSEGNKLTKDKEGKVTSVVDKSGETLTVTEYLKTHSWVESSDVSNGSSVSKDSSKTNEQSESSEKMDKPSSNNSDNSGSAGNNDSTVSKGDEVEGEIPVIIATIPDDDNLIELPD